MLGFWTADPNILFNETFERHINHDYTSLVFHLIMKYFYSIYGYTPEYGRYVNLFFGIISIPLMGYLANQISANRMTVYLTLFLTSFNIFLIEYSQESRVYMLTFLFSILNIIFFYKIILQNEKNFINYSLFILISLSCLLLSPFTLIIVFSQIFFNLYIFIFYNVRRKDIFLCILISVFLYCLINFNFIYSVLLSINEITPKTSITNLNFLSHFFFHNFFGSKIMGLIFLISFVSLILFNFKKIFHRDSRYIFLLIMVFISYLIPIILYFLGNAIFHDRYIIIVLISIIVLLSSLPFELNNRKLRNTIIFVMVLSIFTNSLFELNGIRNSTKPNINSAFTDINISQENNFTLYINRDKIVGYKGNKEVKVDNETMNILINYFTATKLYNKYDLKLNSFEQINNFQKIWIICYKPLSGKCDYKKFIDRKYKELKGINYNSIEINLIGFVD